MKSSSQPAHVYTAIDEIMALSGLVTICMHCRKIRDDKGNWMQLEVNISAHPGARFSHGICPECASAVYGMKADAQIPQMDDIRA
jgi:hypothetical protein